MNKKLWFAALLLMGSTLAIAEEPPAPAPAPAPSPAPAPAPAPAPTPTPAPAPTPASKDDKSLLQQLGKGGGPDPEPPAPGPAPTTPEAQALAAAEKDTRRPAHVPAKYWDADKGEVRVEAMSKSVTGLEKRMRDIGLPPETVEGYKFEVPKEITDLGIEIDPAMTAEFRTKALELGLTQKQYEGVMAAHFAGIADASDQVGQFSAAKARTTMLAHYKTEEAMTKAVQRAYATAAAFLPEESLDKILATAGNVPEVMIILDAVGKEMAEDPGVHPDAILDGESLDTLMRGKAGDKDAPYWNAEDPRHKAVVAKVQAHHQAAAAAKKRKSG